MAFNVSVKLRRCEVPIHHVAFQLGHIDPIGRKTTHRLVKCRWQVAHAKDEAGQHARIAALRKITVARHY